MGSRVGKFLYILYRERENKEKKKKEIKGNKKEKYVYIDEIIFFRGVK